MLYKVLQVLRSRGMTIPENINNNMRRGSEEVVVSF